MTASPYAGCRNIADVIDVMTRQPAPRRRFLPAGECPSCDRDRGKAMSPCHDASARCESGKHNHCTCDTCF